MGAPVEPADRDRRRASRDRRRSLRDRRHFWPRMVAAGGIGHVVRWFTGPWSSANGLSWLRLLILFAIIRWGLLTVYSIPSASMEPTLNGDPSWFGRDRVAVNKLAFGPRVLGWKQGLDDRVEEALRRAALWDEVRNRLKDIALSLSGGQQQRLCIARALATSPDVILMDEPASALDPISTTRIEDLMGELKEDYTIVIVTHNMQQAARVADMTAFFSVELSEDGSQRTGILVEYDETTKIFTNPSDKRTEDYVTGRFG